MSISNILRILFYGWFATEILVALAMRTRRSGGKISDRGTMPILWFSIFASISLSFWVGDKMGRNLPGSSYMHSVIALVLLMLGLAIRWTAIVSLGKSFSANVAIRETQTVMKTGLYRWVRHPSYTGLLLCIVSVGFMAQSWISLLIVLVCPTVALLYRIRVEEIALREHFGLEYVEYSRETKRLIPGIY